jgi:hypothetical protein
LSYPIGAVGTLDLATGLHACRVSGVSFVRQIKMVKNGNILLTRCTGLLNQVQLPPTEQHEVLALIKNNKYLSLAFLQKCLVMN